MNNAHVNLIYGTGLSAPKDSQSMLKCVSQCFKSGIYKFDTAPSYGTEEMLSEAIRHSASLLGINRESWYIQTKIDPIQMYDGQIEEYFLGKLHLMGIEYIDALLIHWPVLDYLEDTWEALVKLKKDGYARKIGICNLRAAYISDFCEKNIKPDIIQIERHPLNIFQEEVKICHKMGIEVQDYSPLCKMHDLIKDNTNLRHMATKYGRTLGEIVMRWHIDTGATPVFTSKNPARIEVYSHLMDFRLEESEIKIIESLNCNHKLYLESLVCPGF